MKLPLMTIGGLSAVAMFASCSAVNDSAASADGRPHRFKLPDLADTALVDTPLARLLPAGGLKVVKPREEDLRKMTSGHEKALAYRNERRRGFWIFSGSVHFQEPDLPAPGSEMDGSLLPPKNREPSL